MDAKGEIKDVFMSPEDQIIKFHMKAEELKAMIEAVEHTLIDDGYDFKGRNVTHVSTRQTGIRIGNELSFRGIQMAEEYFERLDERKCETIGFQDFRAMLSLQNGFYGLVHDEEYCSWESWKLFMADNEMPTDKYGQIDIHDFIEYRKRIERLYPLAHELEKSGVGFLPRIQKLWSTIKILIQEVLAIRSTIDSDGEVITRQDNRLSLEEATFVLSCAGICYSREELMRNMIPRARLEKALAALMQDNFKSGYVKDTHRYAKVLLEGHKQAEVKPVNKTFLQTISPSGLIAWVFAGRPAPEYPEMYQKLLNLKYSCIRCMRNFRCNSTILWDTGLHLKERMVFRDYKYDKAELETTFRASNFLSVNIGDEVIESEGTNISWKLNSVDRPDNYLYERKLPRDCGMVFIVDILSRSDASKESVERAANSLKLVLMRQLHPELQKSVYYKNMYCNVVTSESDGSRIIRFSFVYARQCSVDGFLERMYIPYTLADLFNDFSGELKLNIHLLEALQVIHSM